MALDPYSVLGISKTATQDQVRSAYRKLAKKFHPDLNPGNKGAEKKFKEINTANTLLSDVEMRAKFDRGEVDEGGQPKYQQQQQGGPFQYEQNPFYHQTQRNGGRYSSASAEGFDSDIFESLFRNSGRRQQKATGEDVQYSLEVDFKDAVLGAEKEITLPTGRKLKVNIPAGIDSGTKLRLKGLGEPGFGKAAAGDAYVEITVRPSPQFKRVDKNLEIELPISLVEAILGGEVRVPTLESPVLMKVPKGSDTGTKLRVRGKGVGSPSSTDRGDLIVSLKVVMPPKIDTELEDAIQKWSQNHSYDPRGTV
jgi:DnaJ-class molecular chaperone